MKLLKILLTVGVVLTQASGLMACPGASLKINDDVILRGDGIWYASAKNFMDIEKLSEAKQIGVNIEIKDSSGKLTHNLMVLGSHGDKNREGERETIFTSYLVQDVNDAEKHERVLLLRTSYVGNGIYLRKPGTVRTETKKDAVFSQLEYAGCD